MKIAVLGGGHGCYAAAADLSEAGHEVRLWRRDAAALRPVVDAGSIVLKDADGAREVRIALASADMASVLQGAALILSPAPPRRRPTSRARWRRTWPTARWCSWRPARSAATSWRGSCATSGNTAEVAWAETGTLPYLARKHGEREVNVTVRAVRLPTGVYPARREAEAIAVIREAYPSVHGCGDALSGALMNAGPVIHPPLMVMNAAPLQHFERWDIHNEGTQPAVRAVTDRLDLERIAVRETLGYAAPHYPLADHYNNDRWMYGDAHKKLVKSGDWRETHRPAHASLHHRGHRARPRVPGVGGALERHRCADRQWPAGDRRRLPGARPAPRPAHARGPGPGRPGARRAAAAIARRRLTMARFAAVGAGRMGRGIAIAFAYAGHRIALVDLRQRSPEAWQHLCDEARSEIRASLDGAGAARRDASRPGRRRSPRGSNWSMPMARRPRSRRPN